MGMPFSIETNPTALTVLSVNPTGEDDQCLRTISSHSRWVLMEARDCASAMDLLRRHKIGVVLCPTDLMPGTWIDMLDHISELPHVPSLIVTSRLADDRLWSEALNRGAWDVLAKPFDRVEVIRSVKLAWSHWHHKVDPLAAAS